MKKNKEYAVCRVSIYQDYCQYVGYFLGITAKNMIEYMGKSE